MPQGHSTQNEPTPAFKRMENSNALASKPPANLRRLWNERRGPALAAAALLALAAVLVLGWIIADSQGEHKLIKILRTQSETAQREAEQTSAETPTDAAMDAATDAANPQDRTLEEWAELAAKESSHRMNIRGDCE